ISFRTRHPKIMLEAAFGVGPFFVADDAGTFAAEAAEAADNRSVVAELPVAGKRDEICDQPGNVVEAVRPLGMPGNLSFLPGREFGAELLQCQRGLCPEPAEFLAEARI